jgi:K+-sensing histidine kinase KdpD
MGSVKRATPVAVTLSILASATAILWWLRTSAIHTEHLVFFYLLPSALIAMLYGSVGAMLFAIAATVCSAFFLYKPLYSFYVTGKLEVGELICFIGVALIGVKCVAELRRPNREFRGRTGE